jgi:rod shape-determining protein MreD
MSWTRFAVLVIIVTLLQTSFIDVISFADIKPDLLLILLVFFAVYSRTTEAIITSFVIGFAADIAIGATLGPRIISFCLFGTLLANLNDVITIRKMPYQSFTIFATGFCAGILVWLLTSFRALPVAPSTSAIIFTMPLYSALIGPFIFIPLAWLMSIKTHRLSKRQL